MHLVWPLQIPPLLQKKTTEFCSAVFRDLDSRSRTYNYLIQSQAPYQFGYIPKIQRDYDTAVSRFLQVKNLG